MRQTKDLCRVGTTLEEGKKTHFPYMRTQRARKRKLVVMKEPKKDIRGMTAEVQVC
jgi:hypothetical protein